MSADLFFVHPSSIVDAGAQVGAGTRIWHFCHLMPSCIVGDNCNIGQNAYIDNNVRIGNNVKIQNNVSVYNGVTIEDDVFLGPSMVFTNVVNPRSFIERKDEFKKTLLRKGVSVGANATILCGVEIGSYAMIGAGSMVVSNLPPYALVVGNPAHQIGWVSEAGITLDFNADGLAVCPASGKNTSLKINWFTRGPDTAKPGIGTYQLMLTNPSVSAHFIVLPVPIPTIFARENDFPAGPILFYSGPA